MKEAIYQGAGLSLLSPSVGPTPARAMEREGVISELESFRPSLNPVEGVWQHAEGRRRTRGSCHKVEVDNIALWLRAQSLSWTVWI